MSATALEIPAVQQRPDWTAPDPQRRQLRITLCPSKYDRFATAMRDGPADATDIIQRYLARFLVARGHELTYLLERPGSQPSVCTADLEQPTPAQATWTASRPFRLAENACWRAQRALGVPYLNVFSQLRLADEAAQAVQGSDLVLERSWLYRDGVSRACKRTKTPYALFVEADEILEYDYMGKPLEGLLLGRARRAFQRNLDAADCVLCVSDQLRQHLAENWGVPRSRIVVFENAVDVERFQATPEDARSIRRALGVGDAPLLVFVGNFYRWHDVPAALEAYRTLLETRPELRLALVGDGAERAAMEELARTLGVADRTVFTGRVPHQDVPKYFAAADVALAPYPEMDHAMWLSPLKVYEAMAGGAPVVTSSIGQLEKLVEDGRTGLLTPPGDVPALASAVERLLADPARRERIGRQAREHIVANHSWRRYIERLEAVLEAVADRRSPQGR